MAEAATGPGSNGPLAYRAVRLSRPNLSRGRLSADLHPVSRADLRFVAVRRPRAGPDCAEPHHPSYESSRDGNGAVCGDRVGYPGNLPTAGLRGAPDVSTPAALRRREGCGDRRPQIAAAGLFRASR